MKERLEFELPWPGNQLKKLSRALRSGTPPPAAAPSYDEVMLFYNEVAATVQEHIARHDWSEILGDRQVTITSRPKTIDTLVQKLQRDPNTPMTSVQDIAGVRFEAEMSLTEEDAVASEICRILNQTDDCVHDLRAKPHSGYRAVHLWLRLPSVRAEVQIRTRLQGAWANLYETAADLIGRDIRYGHLPAPGWSRHLVEGLQSISVSSIALIEELKELRHPNLEDKVKETEQTLRTGMFQMHEDLLKLKVAYEGNQRTE